MSTRVEGGTALVTVTAYAALSAGTAHLSLTVREGPAPGTWRYNLSVGTDNRANSGRVAGMTNHMDVLRYAAGVCAGGYQPGTIERGLLEQFAAAAGLERLRGRGRRDVMTGDWPAVGTEARRRMTTRKITTAELARRTALSETTIRSVRAGNVAHKGATLVTLAAGLSWPPQYLRELAAGKTPTGSEMNNALKLDDMRSASAASKPGST